MVDESARQKAEDHYYAALDLVAEGDQEHALAEYQLSLAADPVFTEAMHGMARTLQNLDRLDEAITVEREVVSNLFGTDDGIEGVRAFLEKRPPTFRGR